VKRDKPRNLPASVSDRLRTLAHQRQEENQNLLNRYGLERWLYRMSRSAHSDRFVLKGAMLFSLWSDTPHRQTRDLDLLGFGSSSIPELESVIREICAVTVEPDGLEFLLHSVRGGAIRVEEEYAGVRIKLMAMLGKARIPIQIDVGFGDSITPAPEEQTFPTLLDFPAPHLRAYRRETVIAEKFHAMVDIGLSNTRLKDYFDIRTLAQQFEFEGEILAAAIKATFERRQTPLPSSLPAALGPQFAADSARLKQWTAFLKKNNLPATDASLEETVKLIGEFLMPPVSAINRGENFETTWYPGGYWQSKSPAKKKT